MNEAKRGFSIFNHVNADDFISEFGGRKSAARILLAVLELDEALNDAGIPHNCNLDYIIIKDDEPYI